VHCQEDRVSAQSRPFCHLPIPPLNTSLSSKEVVEYKQSIAENVRRRGKEIEFGLIFFSSSEVPFSGDKYRLVIEASKFADQHSFSSVWIPERHFTKDGWLYPNPAVLTAALARETSQIHLRAGSVVMPLHNPLRVAEEWAMVDNLSGGRVGISFASGWNPNDFALLPENYAIRNEAMYNGIETVRKLWRGESIHIKGGDGKLIEVRTYPTPIQSELPIWITAAGNPKTFARAGAIGAHVLTHMYNHDIDDLAEKIHIYRNSLAEHGYDPNDGNVSVMLHTFIGPDAETVRAQIQRPFSEYLKSASYLFGAIAYSRGQNIDLNSLSEQDLQDYLLFVMDRLISNQRVLFGTPEICREQIELFRAVGVDEIACQIDFGIDIDLVLQNMPYLNALKEQCNHSTLENHSPMYEKEHVNGRYNQHGAYYIAHIPPKQQSIIQTNGADSTHALSPQQSNPLQDIQQRCREEVSVAEFYRQLSIHGIQLTASFQGIEHLWRGEGEALGHIRLPKALEQDANVYQLHPTLLDACFQVVIATLPDALFASEDVLYLPVGIRSFQLHKSPEGAQQVWSHARLQNEVHSAISQESLTELIESDVRILDEQGELFAEAFGLQLQRSMPLAQTSQPRSRTDLEDWLYELHWEPIPLPKLPLVTQPSHWLIFTDSHGIGEQLGILLAGQGQTYTSIIPGSSYQVIDQGHYQINPASTEDMRRMIEEVSTASSIPLKGIVHLWSLDATPVAITSLASLQADQVRSSGSALILIHALIAAQSAEQTRLWLVTQGAQTVDPSTDLSGEKVGTRFIASAGIAVSPSASPISISQAPLWGLGKTCAMEHPELWGGLIDLDPMSEPTVAATQLLQVLSTKQKENQIAFRQGQSYVARMVRKSGLKQQPLTPRQHASYLITGGLWGLGLQVARWLVQKGAKHLVLLGRTKLPPRTSWEQLSPESRIAHQVAGIQSLEELGADVHYAAIDVANEEQLTTFLHDFAQQDHPPIRGVIHAASVWQDTQGQSLVRPLANLTIADLQEVLRPKMLGGWLLHTLLWNEKLDFFISFSSGASLFGSAAQGNYAAASEFLDMLAYYQRKQGQSALSINWGAISEIGFGATSEGIRV
jgi:phthiocerol/phenolphthiocerol synthesis type-I polyketide synthase D